MIFRCTSERVCVRLPGAGGRMGKAEGPDPTKEINMITQWQILTKERGMICGTSFNSTEVWLVNMPSE